MQRFFIVTLAGVFLFISTLFLYPNLVEAQADAEFKLMGSKNAIFLPILINDIPYTFLFDTGATYTILDSSFKPFLGQPLQMGKVETATGQSEVEYYNPLDVIVGGINLKAKSPFLVTDLDFFTKVIGSDFHGLIGMASIYKHIWDINFDDETIKVHSERDTSLRANGFVSIDMFATGQGIPSVPVNLGTKESHFIVDTGDSGSGRLTTEMIDFLINNNLVESVAWDSSVSLSGITKIRRVRVREMKVGTSTYKGLLMREGHQNALGIKFLNRHHVIMDFLNSKLYLKKGLGTFRVDCEDKSGIKLINHDGQLVVALVDGRGPAKAGGIKRGDIIQRINNSTISGKDLNKIREILKGNNNEKISLVIKRNQEVLNVPFVLQEGFDYSKPQFE